MGQHQLFCSSVLQPRCHYCVPFTVEVGDGDGDGVVGDGDGGGVDGDDDNDLEKKYGDCDDFDWL